MFHLSKYMSAKVCASLQLVRVCVCKKGWGFIIHCQELTLPFLFYPEMRKTFQTWHDLTEDDCWCAREHMFLNTCVCADHKNAVMVTRSIHRELNILTWLEWKTNTHMSVMTGEVWRTKRKQKQRGVKRKQICSETFWSQVSNSYHLLWSWGGRGCWEGHLQSLCTPALVMHTWCIFGGNAVTA